MSPQPDQHYGPKPRGFTIVELLIVIAVIILLLSILIVAVNAATRTAQSASTRTLMNSMKQALVRFKADIGYYPPVLGDVSPTDFTPDNHDLRKLFDPRGEDLIAGTMVLGVVVGTIVLALFLPLVRMIESVSTGRL